MNPREVLEFAKKNKVQIVDLKFVDLLGACFRGIGAVQDERTGVAEGVHDQPDCDCADGIAGHNYAEQFVAGRESAAAVCDRNRWAGEVWNDDAGGRCDPVFTGAHGGDFSVPASGTAVFWNGREPRPGVAGGVGGFGPEHAAAVGRVQYRPGCFAGVCDPGPNAV